VTVCCKHNRCPDRPRRWLRRFVSRPWYCPQCGRLWITRRVEAWDSYCYEWRLLMPTPMHEESDDGV